jgi:hypothetical protein
MCVMIRRPVRVHVLVIAPMTQLPRFPVPGVRGAPAVQAGSDGRRPRRPEQDEGD